MDGNSLSVPYITTFLAQCRELLNGSDDLALILGNMLKKQKIADE